MKRRWHLTFHGGPDRSDLNSIHVYSPEGRHIGKALDRTSLPADLELRELRGHTFGPDGDLYVANAFKEYSQIIRFHGAHDRRGKHAFREVFVWNDPIANPGLSHPFSITFDLRGDLYVTSQNTSLVMRYHGPNSIAGKPGSPMPLPESLARSKHRKFVQGTFCASAREVAHGLTVVRAAAFAQGFLWVVDRDADCVRKYEPVTGAHLDAIAARDLIDKPIQLAADGTTLYIGNRGNESVVKFDLLTGKMTPFNRPKSGGLNNPSGLAFGNDGWFYVGSRGSRQILRFRLSDGLPDARLFIDELEDEPEFIERIDQ